MKMSIFLLACILCSLILYETHTLAETPSTIILPSKEKTSHMQQNTVVTPTAVSIDRVTLEKLIQEKIEDMLTRGLLRGEKGDKGDPGVSSITSSYNPESSTLQSIYIPGGAFAPDGETYFSVSNLSGKNITGDTASFGDMSSSGTASVKNLIIGSTEHTVGITMYDRVTLQAVCIYSEQTILKVAEGVCKGEAAHKENSVEIQSMTPQNEVITDVSTTTTNSEPFTETDIATSTPETSTTNQ